MNSLLWFRTGVQDAEHTCDGVDEIDFGALLETGRDIALRRVDDGELTADCVELYATSWAHGYDSVYQRHRAEQLRYLAHEAARDNGITDTRTYYSPVLGNCTVERREYIDESGSDCVSFDVYYGTDGAEYFTTLKAAADWIATR